MRTKFKISIVSAFILFLVPAYAFARIGVGVGVGKIEVEDKLKPGVIYELPNLTILNTGDVPGEYEAGIEYHEYQPELKPPREWFEFSPPVFFLNPGEVQTVRVKLNLPLRIEPGDYFAYLEGRPVMKNEAGQTTIGVAAAAKLYFTVVPGSFWEGVYFKLLSLWRIYTPWPQRVLIGLTVAVILVMFKRFFKLEINLKNNKSAKHHSGHDPYSKKDE